MDFMLLTSPEMPVRPWLADKMWNSEQRISLLLHIQQNTYIIYKLP